MDLLLAVPLALTSALLFATSNVVEQRVAVQTPIAQSMRPGLLVTLARRRLWVAGFVADVGGYGAQAAALAFGPLLVVAPILASGLLFSLWLDAATGGRSLSRSDLSGALLLCGGLALFLAVGTPTEGPLVVPAADWAPVIVVLGVVVVLCASALRLPLGGSRAALLGLAAGITFGVNAAMTKIVVDVLGDRPVSALWHWELYALAALSISGLLMVQSAFQAGSLAAALPTLEVAEPVVATAIGVAILGEHLDAHGNGGRAVLATAALGMLVGLTLLARSRAAERPPHAGGEPERSRLTSPPAQRARSLGTSKYS